MPMPWSTIYKTSHTHTPVIHNRTFYNKVWVEEIIFPPGRLWPNRRRELYRDQQTMWSTEAPFWADLVLMELMPVWKFHAGRLKTGYGSNLAFWGEFPDRWVIWTGECYDNSTRVNDLVVWVFGHDLYIKVFDSYHGQNNPSYTCHTHTLWLRHSQK